MEASTSFKKTDFDELSLTKSNRRSNDDDEFGYSSDAEYYDNIDNGLGDDWDPSQPLEPLIPIIYSRTFESLSSDSVSRTILEEDIVDSDNDNHDEEQKVDNDVSPFEVFFNTVIDEELEGEITIISWISALKELDLKMSEKEMYRVFNFIDQERQGYIDSVDFVSFCTKSSFENDDDVGKLQCSLTNAIKKHPFMINATRLIAAK